jgi:pantothenate kinase
MQKNPPPEIAPLLSKAVELLRAGKVLADEKPMAVLPTAEDMREALLPLLEWCAEGETTTSGRGLVGIAAPAGGGKTLLLAWLAATAAALEWEEFAFLPLDGYHLPNAVLDRRIGLDPEGNPVSLRKLKGTPPTFDAERLLADLRALKSDARAHRLPGYSRVLHDPIPDRIRIGPEVKWIFVEGNYLFLDQPTWREIRGLFDRKVFLDADDAVLHERLARRHAAAGRDAEWIENHFRRTDGPNIRLIRTSAHFADVAFRWDRSGRLSIADCRMIIG